MTAPRNNHSWPVTVNFHATGISAITLENSSLAVTAIPKSNAILSIGTASLLPTLIPTLIQPARIDALLLSSASGIIPLATINGTVGDDKLNGTNGNDTLNGLGGNDELSGGTGNDTLIGSDGDDTYLIAQGDGQDTIREWTGIDTVKFSNIKSTDIISVRQVGGYSYNPDLLLTYGSGQQLTVVGYFDGLDYRIEQFQFSDGKVWGWADIKPKVLQGTNGDDVLRGFDDGNDTLNGFGGNDRLWGDDGNDTLNGFDGNDWLSGDDGNDTLNGGTGNDYLGGGGRDGNDTYLIAQGDGQDEIWDVGGIDTVKFSNIKSTDITDVQRIIDFADGDELLLIYGSGQQLTVDNYFADSGFYEYRIEQFQFSDGKVWGWADIKPKVLQGTNGDDVLHGFDDGNDTLNGLGGNDTLSGYAGNDILNGGTGNDMLYGGFGNDVYLIAQGDGQDQIWDATGNNIVKFTNIKSTDITHIQRVQDVFGEYLDLQLTYGSGQQLTIGGYFQDSGLRIKQFQFSDGKTWEWPDIKLKVLQGTDGYDSLQGYDDENDTLNGLGGNDMLVGNGGNDTLNGGTGNDSLSGSEGNDTYLIAQGDGQDQIWEVNGMDTIKFSNIKSTNITSVQRVNYLYEDLLLTYGSGEQLTIGRYFQDSGHRIEQFQFSDGKTWEWVDIKFKVLQATNGDDVLFGYDDENDILNGLGGNDFLDGHDGNDSLNGGKDDDYLFGNNGNDSLNGGDGNDVLDGGNGSDMAHYWTAKMGVEINLSLTTAQNTLGAGTDTLLDIENLNGSAFNDTLTGNNTVNSLYGNGGNDILKGLDGNDSLAGGVGNDRLDGGVGEDFGQYWQATAGVVVDLRVTTAQNTQGAGIDTLEGIEHLNGSAFNDTLIGNASNNRLLGGAGNDSINGFTGKDALTGGAGQDRFVFNTAPGINNLDVITDFNVADDTLVLENAIFTTLSQTGILFASLFKVLGTGGAVDADDRVLYNSLTGSIAYDADGAGGTAAVNIALIGKGLSLTAADFSVV